MHCKICTATCDIFGLLHYSSASPLAVFLLRYSLHARRCSSPNANTVTPRPVLGPHTRGSACRLGGLPPPPHCPACCLAPKSHWLVARCVRCVHAFSLRSPCTPIHLPIRTTGGGYDGPKSRVTLRVHTPRFRPRRRPCSHLRRTPCDQDDQPADKAGASHAGAHDCHCALPFRVRA